MRRSGSGVMPVVILVRAYVASHKLDSGLGSIAECMKRVCRAPWLRGGELSSIDCGGRAGRRC